MNSLLEAIDGWTDYGTGLKHLRNASSFLHRISVSRYSRHSSVSFPIPSSLPWWISWHAYKMVVDPISWSSFEILYRFKRPLQWHFTLAPAIRGVPESSQKTSLLSESTAPSILPTSKSVDDAPFSWWFNVRTCISYYHHTSILLNDTNILSARHDNGEKWRGGNIANSRWQKDREDGWFLSTF